MDEALFSAICVFNHLLKRQNAYFYEEYFFIALSQFYAKQKRQSNVIQVFKLKESARFDFVQMVLHQYWRSSRMAIGHAPVPGAKLIIMKIIIILLENIVFLPPSKFD